MPWKRMIAYMAVDMAYSSTSLLMPTWPYYLLKYTRACTMNNQTLNWHRGEYQLKWNGESVTTPHPVLWAAEPPTGDGVAVVTLFDEQTPNDEPNAFIYRSLL